MKYFFIRFQLILVSVVLLVTFSLMMAIVMRYNFRWDFTKEKVYSLSEHTVNLLKQLKDKKIEVLAFYSHDDPLRQNFEVFIRQCQLYHPAFEYNFYDPDRVPSLAKKYDVKDPYTVVIRYGALQEKITNPSEESIANALLRLANPKRFDICFVTGHGEAMISAEGRNGLKLFSRRLEENNYRVLEATLARDKVPSECHVFVVAGPHREFDPSEYQLLKQIFAEGRSILFLIDPMDPGTGKSFVDFMRDLGVTLAEDVIVDKMSRLVGGDFLVPLVSQYVADHPITKKFDQPTFFPVARGVHPAVSASGDLEVVPLALSGSGSWSETNLAKLENGDATFDPEADLPGPICLAVAVEKKVKGQDPAAPPGGRMVVVGDSDFVTNAYVDLSGNGALALNMVQWLARDDRFISIHPHQLEFKPLFLNEQKRFLLFVLAVVSLPLLIFLIGAVRVLWRRKVL